MSRNIRVFLMVLLLSSPLRSSDFFDGADDVLLCGGSGIPIAPKELTLSAWIKEVPDGISTLAIIITRNRTGSGTIFPYQMRIEPDPSGFGFTALACEFLDDGGSNNSIISDCSAGPCLSEDDGWHHVACRYDGSDLVPFIDGLAYPSLAVSASISTVDGEVYIGSDDIGSSFFLGEINDPAIYNRVLSQAEISTLYLSQMRNYVIQTDSRMAYWPLDDFAEGTTVGTSSFIDRSGNGNNCAGASAGTGGTALADFLRYK